MGFFFFFEWGRVVNREKNIAYLKNKQTKKARVGGVGVLSPLLLIPFATLVLHAELKWKQSLQMEVALGLGCDQGVRGLGEWEATTLSTRHRDL